MSSAGREDAERFDQEDPLAPFREQFVVADPDLIYLDGNSLGRMPKRVVERMRNVVEHEWGERLIRAWNEGWWEAPGRVGEKIAPLLGAAPGQVTVSDQTSVDLFKLAVAALKLRRDRRRIITDTLNFPSDLYVLQGVVDTLGAGHEIIRVGPRDFDITPDLEALEAAIQENTALVTLSHVIFKSGYVYDMRQITELVHQRGALVVWDLSHSAGVLPIELDACNVDFAVGCTYKYLNGGPGSPAFLYVNKSLQEQAMSPIRGWWGERQPFAFGLDYRPGAGVTRFMAGTAPMLSLLALEEALTPVVEAGIARLREKSIGLTEYAIGLYDALLAPLGFSLGSPREAKLRGSHVSVRHPDGYRINRALIDEMKTIPDFREPDNLRLGFAPLYTSYVEVWEGFDRIRRVVAEKRHEKYANHRTVVT